MKERHLVAIGGGSLATREHRNPLDRYCLELTGKTAARVCYVGTASGDRPDRFEEFKTAWNGLAAEVSELSLFHPHTRDIRGFLLGQDLIWVGGGNTRNLLLLWAAWGVDTALREAWETGVVLAGSSAGGLCWYEDGLTDSFGPGYEPLSCLGWRSGSFCPHWDGEPERQNRYLSLVRDGILHPGWAVDEMVGLHYADDALARIVSGREGAGAYRVSRQEEGVQVEPHPATLLP